MFKSFEWSYHTDRHQYYNDFSTRNDLYAEKVWPRVNEGCFVIRRNGTYYMTYSANSYESPFYGIGCATADSPLGP